jgi:hypothetical protein
VTGHFRSPERLLADLGIAEPADIDLDAIAFECGALVVRDTLRGCEARLLGAGSQAFITVNAVANVRRQRFSIGHELGHWMHDRGAASFRCTKRDFIRNWDQVSPEQRANRYAADLLLPKAMFQPRARQQPMTLATVSDLAEIFATSLTSTAIRLIEYGSFPAMIVLVGPNGVRWRKRGPDVPSQIWLRDRPTSDSVAFDLLRGGSAPGPTEVSAGAWIADADRYSLWEDSRRVTDEDVLTILWWKDEAQLLENESTTADAD